jgi:hypothetical protein
MEYQQFHTTWHQRIEERFSKEEILANLRMDVKQMMGLVAQAILENAEFLYITPVVLEETAQVLRTFMGPCESCAKEFEPYVRDYMRKELDAFLQRSLANEPKH